MTTHDNNFSPHNPYAKEAEEKWGKSDAWKQSQERVKKMTKAQFQQIGQEADDITRAIAALAEAGRSPSDPAVQALVDRHYHWLRNWYEPSLDMYRGLASMYVDDPGFEANYEKYRPGMAVFIRDAMHAYCDAKRG